jgi:hypothetical protein
MVLAARWGPKITKNIPQIPLIVEESARGVLGRTAPVMGPVEAVSGDTEADRGGRR